MEAEKGSSQQVDNEGLGEIREHPGKPCEERSLAVLTEAWRARGLSPEEELLDL